MKHKKYSLFIGKFQPPHKGHFAIIDKLLKERKNILICIRETKMDRNNPLYICERFKIFKNEYIKYLDSGRIIIQSISDISEVVYGRDVGYKIRKLKLPKKIEKISATKIRNGKYRIIN